MWATKNEATKKRTDEMNTSILHTVEQNSVVLNTDRGHLMLLVI